MAYLEVPAAAVDAADGHGRRQDAVLMLMVLVLLMLGTFMDIAPLIIICTPIFLPVARAFGVDPVHFGVILILTAGIGLITPPVGSVLFVGSAIGKISIDGTMRSIWPFFFAASVLLLVTCSRRFRCGCRARSGEPRRGRARRHLESGPRGRRRDDRESRLTQCRSRTPLCEGGIRVIEVTLRTEAAVAAIERIASGCPTAIVGAGTARSAAEFRPRAPRARGSS